MNRNGTSGFTLIELMITVAIVAILAAVALPAYTDYVTRGKIPEATNALSGMRVQLEQYYQDNRNYGSTDSICGVANPTSTNFDYSCDWGTGGNSQSYLVTASGKTGGSMSAFEYTIDQAGTKTTNSTIWGNTSTSCWIIKKGGGC